MGGRGVGVLFSLRSHIPCKKEEEIKKCLYPIHMMHADEQFGKSGGNLTFCSWNVNGINEPVKRGKVLSHLKSLHTDFIFLQETHLKNDSHSRLRCRWIQQIYHSNFSIKARGVAILIRKGVPFKHTSTIADKDGRYLILVGEIHSTPMTLLNIYGPNLSQLHLDISVLFVLSFPVLF